MNLDFELTVTLEDYLLKMGEPLFYKVELNNSTPIFLSWN